MGWLSKLPAKKIVLWLSKFPTKKIALWLLKFFEDIVFFLGLLCITAGVRSFSVPISWIVLGMGLISFALLISRR